MEDRKIFTVSQSDDGSLAVDLYKGFNVEDSLYVQYLFTNNIARKIKELIFHAGVTQIPHCNFSALTAVEKITFPNTLKTIGIMSFRNLIQLEKLELPENVEELGILSFADCSKLKTVLADSCKITCLPHSAFYNCSSLTTFFAPRTLTEIENDSFHLCSKLEQIIFPTNYSYENLVVYRNFFKDCPLAKICQIDPFNGLIDITEYVKNKINN